jgi:superoxide reductase
MLASRAGFIYFLKSADTPEAMFEVKAEKIKAREYCNLHGLWKGGES